MDKKIISRKYGKSSNDIFEIKKSFILLNDELLKERENNISLLREQPKRCVCKICGHNLSDTPFFITRGMQYMECDNCGHINSRNMDTQQFAEKIYIEQPYANNYHETSKADYELRLNNVYAPKAEFMIQTLVKDGLDKFDIRLLDDGAGSGYFVEAVNRAGCYAEGIEVSESQVRFGNDMSGKNNLRAVSGDAAINIIRSIDTIIAAFYV